MLIDLTTSDGAKLTFDVLDDKVDWVVSQINDNCSDLLCWRVENQHFDERKHRWVIDAAKIEE